jgi:hypothetical protein
MKRVILVLDFPDYFEDETPSRIAQEIGGSLLTPYDPRGNTKVNVWVGNEYEVVKK